jgi:hypothetical protein
LKTLQIYADNEQFDDDLLKNINVQFAMRSKIVSLLETKK